VRPVAGGSERDRDLIEQLVAEGRIPRAAVDAVEQLWQEQLQPGIILPNEQTITIVLTDIYHLLQDSRIRRKPERIALLLMNIFEIREAQWSRQRGLSRWQEGEQSVTGYAILTPDNALVTMHLVRESELRRLRRQGAQLWP
jgi:hypothetical protein